MKENQASQEIIIRLSDIQKRYDQVTVLNHFSLDVAKGEFLTMIGSSGCGKTTILKLMNGLIIPDAGDVFVNGKNLRESDLIALRRTIGYCIQGSVLFPHLNVSENITYVPKLSRKLKRSEQEELTAKWLDFVGLDVSLRSRFPEELSGGQQQRVGIARALSSDPDILLMDEPFGAVDSITRSELQRELKEIHTRTKKTIVFVTHDISEALYLGTKVLVLHAGEIQQYAPPGEIKKAPANAFVKKLLS